MGNHGMDKYYQPEERMNESYATKAKVLYSDTGLYFLFDCADKKLTTYNDGR